MKPTFAFQIHITDECDQRCEHCYLFSGDNVAPMITMSLSNVIKVLNSCYDMCETLGRQPYFYITGGDPLLHPNFWHIAEELHKRGAMWAVMGNPFHLTAEVCTSMKALGCRKYQLSLDGLEAMHDRFRKPGSFAATLAAVPLIQQAGIWCSVMTTVSSANKADIPALIDLVAQLEVDVFAFGRYCPTSNQKRDEFHIEPLEYRAFLLECQQHIETHEANGCKTTFQRKDHLWTLLEYEQGKFTIPEGAQPGVIYDGCHCGISHMTVLPSGDVYACRRMGSRVGNVFEASMHDIFLGAPMESCRQFDKFEKCSKCELLGFCRGCPAVAAGYTGNQYAPDPQCWKEVD